MKTLVTSELSGAAVAASGGGPKGRNVLERFVRHASEHLGSRFDGILQLIPGLFACHYD